MQAGRLEAGQEIIMDDNKSRMKNDHHSHSPQALHASSLQLNIHRKCARSSDFRRLARLFRFATGGVNQE